MYDVAELVKDAKAMAVKGGGEFIARATLRTIRGEDEKRQFVEKLARMIAANVPFASVPLPDGCSGRLHDVDGVIVREIMDYDFHMDAPFVRFDAALQH